MAADGRPETLLLVDTCGERGSVALVHDGQLQAEVLLPERAASAGLLGAVRQVLSQGGIGLDDLTGIGVVHGPGSFTGLRVGLAVCKGLAEAIGLPFATVSRLRVLAHAAEVQDGFAILRAGRDQVFVLRVRQGMGEQEQLLELGAFLTAAAGQHVAFAEESLGPSLEQANARVRQVVLSAKDALRDTVDCLAQGGTNLASADVNYVRDEESIYARPRA